MERDKYLYFVSVVYDWIFTKMGVVFSWTVGHDLKMCKRHRRGDVDICLEPILFVQNPSKSGRGQCRHLPRVEN